MFHFLSHLPMDPKSKRFVPLQPKTNDAVVVTFAPTFPEEIRCQGLSGSPDHRLAIINNKTVEKGEKWDFTLKTGQRVQIHCIEVKEKGVILEINGIIKELGLPVRLR